MIWHGMMYILHRIAQSGDHDCGLSTAALGPRILRPDQSTASHQSRTKGYTQRQQSRQRNISRRFSSATVCRLALSPFCCAPLPVSRLRNLARSLTPAHSDSPSSFQTSPSSPVPKNPARSAFRRSRNAYSPPTPSPSRPTFASSRNDPLDWKT